MRMRMPAAYDRIDYYGRGPWENYADRKDGALVGRYRQTVDEQFYPYIRPQETGTKSDVRRWRQHDIAGRGVEVTASEPFSASALHYAQEALDEGLTKQQGHSQEIEPDDAVWLCIDKAQYGLGCVHSWGALPAPRIPHALRKLRIPLPDHAGPVKTASGRHLCRPLLYPGRSGNLLVDKVDIHLALENLLQRNVRLGGGDALNAQNAVENRTHEVFVVHAVEFDENVALAGDEMRTPRSRGPCAAPRRSSSAAAGP